MRVAALLCLVACEPSVPAPLPAPAPAVQLQPDAQPERPPPPAAYPELAALPDVAGAFVRKKTAVLLIAARAGTDTEPTEERRFIPLVCSIKGTFATGKACGAAMPARATIRTPAGPLVVSRSTKIFRDTSGEQVYKPPFAPACCMYNTCREVTIPYTGKAAPEAPASRFGVWPADADVDLQISTTVPVQSDQGTLGARAIVLLATSDVDGDGTRERTVYEVWANDFGIQVVPEGDAKELYSFSCGNI